MQKSLKIITFLGVYRTLRYSLKFKGEDYVLKQKYASLPLATKIIKNISKGHIWCYGCRHLVSLYLLTHLSKLRFVIISTDTISASSSYYTPNSFQMLFEQS